MIKEVNGSHGPTSSCRCFPGRKMIFMLRDGRDILDSMVDANSAGRLDRPGAASDRAGFETDEERLDLVRENGRNWTARINACEQAYERHDPALRQRIRYEDLLADPKRSLAQLTEWLGLPHDEARIGEIVARHSFDEVPEKRRGPGRRWRAASPGTVGGNR